MGCSLTNLFPLLPVISSFRANFERFYFLQSQSVDSAWRKIESFFHNYPDGNGKIVRKKCVISTRIIVGICAKITKVQAITDTVGLLMPVPEIVLCKSFFQELASDQAVRGLILAESRNLSNRKCGSVAQSRSLMPSHHPHMTEILLERTYPNVLKYWDT